VVTKPGDVLALDPDQRGELVWRVNASGPVVGDKPRPGVPTPGGIFWGAAFDEDSMYFALTRGGAGAIELATGKRLWLKSVQDGVRYSSAATAFPGVMLAGTPTGALQAISTEDGSLLWSFDTMREFDTVNGVKARGGSINALGPVVADGLVLVGSGYAIIGGTPGNVVLAFSRE
jgi:polyvinyl alcohol dehydrogenase (cytochrome)